MSSTPGTAMRVRFVKLSDRRHRVEVHRADSTVDSVELDTRSFLRHDLAHYAVEATFGLDGGVWGSIAAGGGFDGAGLNGPDMALAERLAGPTQTLMRVGAGPPEIADTLDRVAPELATPELVQRLHDWMRALAGHWLATAHGDAMELEWPPVDGRLRRAEPTELHRSPSTRLGGAALRSWQDRPP